MGKGDNFLDSGSFCFKAEQVSFRTVSRFISISDFRKGWYRLGSQAAVCIGIT